jgi:hypothetical protein
MRKVLGGVVAAVGCTLARSACPITKDTVIAVYGDQTDGGVGVHSYVSVTLLCACNLTQL